MVASEMQGQTSPLTSRRRIPSGKLWLFRGLMIVLMCGALELFSFAVWMTFPPIVAGYYMETLEAVATAGTERANNLEVLHPYLGWVFNPDTVDSSPGGDNQLPVNSLGFVDSHPSLGRRSPDQFIVGVFGGSVAQQLSMYGDEVLCRRLQESPRIKGRKIRIVRLAMSGFKQPQQLMALNYILALGGEFDVVINVDGYNETALVATENHQSHIFAAYPRAWHVRLMDVVDPRNSDVSYRLLQIRATRQSRASRLYNSPLQRSGTASLIWAIQDQSLQREQVQLGAQLMQRFQGRGRGFAREGPRQLYADENGMYRQIVDIWKNCSLQMHHLCSARGIRYFHFLQPNQYLEGSKSLNSYEREKCFAPAEDHAQSIVRGYPQLILTGQVLRRDGVAFHDLTQLFAGITDTIYSDYFCHYNAEGTNMLADTVGRTIVDSLAGDPSSNPVQPDQSEALVRP